MRRRHALALAAIIGLAAAGIAAFEVSHAGFAQGNVSEAAAPAGGAPAGLGQFIPTDPPRPAPAASFADDAGTPLSLADFRGRLVLVNLWATWCAPCIREMPALDRLAAKLGGADLTVLIVSQDRGGDKIVAPFFAKLGLATLKTSLDPKGNLGRAFAVRGLPTTILLDGEGRELGRVEGAADWDGAAIEAMLRGYVERARRAAGHGSDPSRNG